jgi:diaminopimelate decarboxylase
VGQFAEQTLKLAVAEGLIDDHSPMAAFVDVDGVRQTVRNLQNAFPDHFQHAFAAKANTMLNCLSLVREAGMSCEVASRGELAQALNAGFSPENIVYDEPAKLPFVIDDVLERGVALNIDNFQEFDRIRQKVERRPSESRLGFRINPQVGAGRIGAMSTATRASKFGVALEDEGNRERLIGLYRTHGWLSTLHSHVGSQGIALEKMVAGIRKVADLANEINERCGRRQVEVIDIGGGLPVNFDSEEMRPTFAEFAGMLQSSVPELFSGEFRVKTEYGRSILAKNGFIVSRVEYTKQAGGRHIAITHAGAQIATRTVFMPDAWPIRLSVFDANGQPSKAEELEQDFAGPLCFAGDMIGTGRMLPRAEPGNLVVMHDTGAYYFSNPFFYNALPSCAVYGVEHAPDGKMQLACWRAQQSLEQTLAVIG